MEKNHLNFALIARWSEHQRHDEAPAVIVWSDGVVASMEDFKKHSRDTQMSVCGPNGESEQRMYPNILAHVHFNEDAGVWTVSGEGVTPFATFLRDRNAPRFRILAELRKFPIRYRCQIHWPKRCGQEGLARGPAHGRLMDVNLYWVSALPDDHDWLIYAPNMDSAAEFHSKRTGAKINRSQSHLIVRRISLAALEEWEPPRYATIEELKELGFRTVPSENGTMAVERAGNFYVQGNRYTDAPEAYSYYVATLGQSQRENRRAS